MKPLRRSERILRLSSSSSKSIASYSPLKKRSEGGRFLKCRSTRSVDLEAHFPTSMDPVVLSCGGRFWKPEGANRPNPARWESEPGRSTFFLEVLVQEKREGRLGSGPPSNFVINTLIRSFWEKFRLVDNKQLRNHYNTRRVQWGILTRLLARTDISWDNEQKMVIADADWWVTNDNNGGMRYFENRPVPDYDLLEELFKDRHATGALLHDPSVPRWPPVDVQPPESEDQVNVQAPDVNCTPDPVQVTNVSQTSSSSRIRRGKKKSTEVDSSSTWVEQIDHLVEGLKQGKEERRVRRSLERAASESVIFKHEEDQRAEVDGVIRILVQEMGLNVTENFYHEAIQVLSTDVWAKSYFLQQTPDTRMGFLCQVVSRAPASKGNH